MSKSEQVYRLSQKVNLPWSKQQYEMDMVNKDSLYIVEKYGFVGSRIVLDEAEITNIGVDPLCQNKGIGTKLLNELCQKLVEKGIRFLFLEVRQSNQKAIGLYKKQGFQEIGKRIKYYCHPVEDAILFKKELV